MKTSEFLGILGMLMLCIGAEIPFSLPFFREPRFAGHMPRVRRFYLSLLPHRCLNPSRASPPAPRAGRTGDDRPFFFV